MILAEGIKYKVIDRRRRLVGTGNYSNVSPNAVNSDFSGKLIIPEEVQDSLGNFYRVTEIGPRSFYQCTSITEVFVPSTIEIIRNYGLARLLNCVTITFGERSKLKKIEVQGLYDFYNVKSFNFTGNCLKSIGKFGMGFAKSIETLSLPSSINYIDSSALVGMIKIKNLYYCGNHLFKDDILTSPLPEHASCKTNESALFYTGKGYGSTKFGHLNTAGTAPDDVCKPLSNLCDFKLCSCNRRSIHSISSWTLFYFLVI